MADIVDKGGHGSGNFGTHSTVVGGGELVLRRRLTRIKHPIEAMVGKQEIPVTMDPKDFRYAFYRGQNVKGKHLFTIYGKAKAKDGSDQELYGHVVQMDLGCCNVFLQESKCSKAGTPAPGAKADPPSDGFSPQELENLAKATENPGNIEALVGWVGKVGFNACVAHLTGKPGIDDPKEVCGRLKAMAREQGVLSPEHEAPYTKEGAPLKTLDVEKIMSALPALDLLHRLKVEYADMPTEIDDAIDTIHDWLDEMTQSPEFRQQANQRGIAMRDENLSEAEKAALDEFEKKGKEDTANVNPDGSFKGGFDGCVAHFQETKGLPEENARKLCAYIGRQSGKIKSEEGRVSKMKDGVVELFVPFAKVDEEQRLVYGVVYEPDVVDAQGDFASADEIRKACHDYMINSRKTGLMHKDDITDKAPAVENYLAPVDMVIGNQRIKKGSWVMGHKIKDDGIWKDIKEGRLTGLSMSGKAVASTS